MIAQDMAVHLLTVQQPVPVEVGLLAASTMLSADFQDHALLVKLWQEDSITSPCKLLAI